MTPLFKKDTFQFLAIATFTFGIALLVLKNTDPVPMTDVVVSQEAPIYQSKRASTPTPEMKALATAEKSAAAVDHSQDLTLEEAILAFEDQVHTEDHNLSSRDLELMGELIGNLNEYQKNESNQ